ncbi:MAG: 16S rRNA (guanine(527)-N(7))-methyltransferase RsmG [Planctomycetaceae bacterium]
MLSPEFSAALAQHGFEIPTEAAVQIEAYAKLLWQWNEQLNLTRHDTWDKFVGRDLRDCLQLAPLIKPGEDVLDLGSGNGIPGIPLAILRPDVNVSLAESVGKRAKVLDEMISDLGVPIAVYEARGEDILDDFRFNTIVNRAVGSLLKLCQWLEPHWGSVDRMLTIKGPKWVAERGEARHHGALNDLQLRVVATYPLGEGESEGVILQIWPKGRELA